MNKTVFFLKCGLVLGCCHIWADSNTVINQPFQENTNIVRAPVCCTHPKSVMYHEGPVPLQYHYLAPDGSEIRLLTEMRNGGLAHCTLRKGTITGAIKHKKIEEIWHVLEGSGLLWRKQGNTETITPLCKGMTVVIPPEISFQFRNDGEIPLAFVIVTMPPWPGSSEAIKVDDFWPLNDKNDE